jgi:hypothetical protein
MLFLLPKTQKKCDISNQQKVCEFLQENDMKLKYAFSNLFLTTDFSLQICFRLFN